MLLFLILIPKMPNLMELRDYRHINPVGCLYKLLAKILANHLKRVIPLIIRPIQGAFVAGRQILDRLLIANKLIDPKRRLKKQEVIDPEKACR